MIPEQEREWLTHHIPSRFRAAMAHTAFHSSPSSEHLDNYTADAVQMGRLAAVRWLIEFVSDKKPRKPQFDTRIDDLGGTLLSTGNKHWNRLQTVFDAISKALAHPTQGSGHCSLELDQLTPIIDILRDRVDAELYRVRAMKLEQFL